MTDIRLGVVGVSEGNGHPYSFASIVNGYSEGGFAATEWEDIAAYLREKHPSEFGFPGVSVTHAWTQDNEETRRLCEAAHIPNAVDSFDELVGLGLDGVLILRDDYEHHLELALSFLEAGTPVFVDKPLALSVDEIRTFEPYLRSGQLLSCSGLRFARELDGPRSQLDSYGKLELARGTVLNDWERYGVHMVDAVLNVLPSRPVSVVANDAAHASVAITMDDGSLVQIDALGAVPKVFAVEFYGTERHSSHEISDNFRTFRRTLWHFVESIRTGEPAIDPEATLDVLRVLVAGRQSMDEGRRIDLSEVGF